MKYIIKGFQGAEYYATEVVTNEKGEERLHMSTDIDKAMEFDTIEDAYEKVKNEYLYMMNGYTHNFVNWVLNTRFEVLEICEEN